MTTNVRKLLDALEGTGRGGQAELAKRLGYTPQMLWKWLRAGVKPSSKARRRLKRHGFEPKDWD